MNRISFHLVKTYLDCIDDTGNCLIVYVAKLKFKFIKISYSGIIVSDHNNKTYERTSFKKNILPVIDHNIGFKDHALNITGEWQRIDDSFQFPLYSNDSRLVLWNCHHPKAIANIEFGWKDYHGFGYAETLTLTIKPWELPLKELRWGRFLSENYTIVWIHWKGQNPLNRIFLNGNEYNDAIFEDDLISFNSGKYKLEFLKISGIRKGKLSNIFSKVPWLKALFPFTILQTQEFKYKAYSSFKEQSNIVSFGWCLYELVVW